uniref:NADH-ubiquinone oxidoreductase chain 2 n=1 Tax=Tryonicus mackerrasae TaxID=2093453 RepID=A0A2P1H907_9NEOP|nr:NADH dehydrogenase subunit 2 [Tryonicus mackerrasae]
MMLQHSTKILFIFTLTSGVLISVSSNSWLGAWMGLEISLLSFIPLMISTKNMLMAEASMKYFIIQAIASSVLMFSIIMSFTFKEMLFYNSYSSMILINSPLLLKSGAAPLHWWLPSVMEGSSWMNCFMLLTTQKMAPLMLISYSLQMNWFSMMIIFLSVCIGSIGGMTQTSIRKILAYSSINHMGWMLAAMLISETTWLTYFSIYSLLTLTIVTMVMPFQVSFINQTFSAWSEMPMLKFMMFTTLLSLGGLPPFLGFLPKWMVIQLMIMNDMSFMITIMVILSLVTLYYYMRLCYSSFMINSHQLKWNNQFSKGNITYLSMFLTSISITGLVMCTLMFNNI